MGQERAQAQKCLELQGGGDHCPCPSPWQQIRASVGQPVRRTRGFSWLPLLPSLEGRCQTLGRRTQILALLQHKWHTHVTMWSHACLLLVRVSLTLCPQPSTQDLVGDMSGIFPSGSPAPACHRPSLLLQKESSGFLPISAGTVPGLRRTASWVRLSLVTARPPHTAATETGSH